MYYAAQDLMEYLLASVSGGVQDSEHRLLRAAAHNAYRDVVNARDWQYHVTTGTIPDTQLQLHQAGNGYAAGWYSYTLPENVKNVDALVPPLTTSIPTVYVSQTDWNRIETKLPTLNAPIYWTVVNGAYDLDGNRTALPNRWTLLIAGTTQPVTYTYTYRRRPSPLRYMGYEPQCRQAGFSVTGAVRRYGTATTFPESSFGVNPFTAEELINIPNSLVGTPPSNAKTVVSDWLDLSDGMYTALLSGAEMWAARLMGKNIEGATAIFNRDLRLAFEADTVAPVAGTRTGGMFIGTARALGYYSPSGPDTGV